MKYQDDIGLIYDIAFYNIIYFNKEEFEKRWSLYDTYNVNDFSFFDKINKKEEIKPLEYLRAFFHYEYGKSSFIDTFLINHLRSDKNYNDFITLIKNKELLLSDFLDFYFNETFDIHNNVKVYHHMNNLNICDELKDSIVTLLINFTLAIDELIYLFELQKEIIYFKRIQINKLSEIKYNLHSIDFKDLLCKQLSIKEPNLDNSFFSICYINPYFSLIKDHGLMYFCVGEKFLIALSHFLKYKNVSLVSYSYVRSNETRNDIINILAKKELTSIDILNEINKTNQYITEDMVLKALQVLLKETMVKRIKKIGRCYLYSLNHEYFSVIYNLEKDQMSLILGDRNAQEDK